jgi:hypothetical protein
MVTVETAVEKIRHEEKKTVDTEGQAEYKPASLDAAVGADEKLSRTACLEASVFEN